MTVSRGTALSSTAVNVVFSAGTGVISRSSPSRSFASVAVPLICTRRPTCCLTLEVDVPSSIWYTVASARVIGLPTCGAAVDAGLSTRRMANVPG